MAYQIGAARRGSRPTGDGAGFRHGRRGLAALAIMTGLTLLATGCAVGGLPAAKSSTPQAAAGSKSAAAAAGAGESGGAGSYGSGRLPSASGSPGSTPGQGSISSGSLDARSGIEGGTLFGGDTPLTSEQGPLGRHLAIVRDYYLIGQRFPNATDRQAMASGSTVLASLDTQLGLGPTYASVAAGRYDRTIKAWLEGANQAAIQYHLSAIYVSFQHEASDGALRPLGTPAQFVAAWDHVHALATSAGLDWNQGGRLHWVWILAWLSFKPAPLSVGPASAFWPGSSEVDIVAVDGYNSVGCPNGGGPTARTPGSIFRSVVGFAQAYGLPVFVAEWGSTAFVANQQPTFINQMQAYVASTPQIAAVMYWDGPQFGTGHHGCGLAYRVNSHPASVAALAAMGQAAALQGRLPPAP
jgi:hypothetical protein